MSTARNFTSAGITGTAALSTSATTGSSVAGGPFAVAAAANNLASANGNYVFTYANAPTGLTVTPATLTISGDNKSIGVGQSVPTLTYTVVSGLTNGDTAGRFWPATSPTSASGTPPVGSYAITQGTLASNSNYSISYANGVLSVGNVITITAQQPGRHLRPGRFLC